MPSLSKKYRQYLTTSQWFSDLDLVRRAIPVHRMPLLHPVLC
jgi:hypothetical protein